MVNDDAVRRVDALVQVGLRLARSAPSGRVLLARIAGGIDLDWIPRPWGEEIAVELAAAQAGAREPVSAKTMLLGDDLLACLLGGVYTDVEKTMIEIQRSPLVQETRNAFQNAMQDKFIKTVQDLTGRRVLAFISNHHVGPDIEIELFLLMPDGASEQDGWTHHS